MAVHYRKLLYPLFLFMLLFSTGSAFSQTRTIDSLKNVLSVSKEDTNKVNTLYKLYAEYLSRNDLDTSMLYATQSLELAKKLRYKKGIGNGLMSTGWVFYNRSDFERARSNYYAAIKVRREINETNRVATAYSTIAQSYIKEDNYAEAFKYYDTALTINQAVLNTEKGLDERSRAKRSNATIYSARAQSNMSRKSFTDALRDLQDAIVLWKEIGDTKGIISGYETLASIYNQQNDLSGGLKIYYDALKLAESIGDKEKMADILNAIAVSYLLQENYSEALKNSYEANRLEQEIGNPYGIALTYNAIGDSYVKVNTEEAIKAFDQALRILSVSFPHSVQEARSYGSIGEALEIQGDSALLLGNEKEAIEKYENALKRHEFALKIMEDLCHQCSSAMLANLGSIFMKLKKYNEARKYITRSLEIANEKRLPTVLVSVYNTLSKLDSAARNYRSAFENYKQYILYRDSLSNDKMTRMNTQTRLQYEFDKKEDSLRQKQVITQTRLDSQKKQKNFYLAGAGMLALLSVFVFLNFRNQKKINRLANDAHAKEKAELELQSLRAQLNPHFMFNSLNAIQELILLEQNEKSQSYLARFAKLLRLLLENADRPFIALQRELDFLQLYLLLENLRIPDLWFSITVDPNINTEATQIPNMILQPYIENAIWHGLSHKENNKRLQIRISNENGSTKYEIEDNGVGRKRSAELKSLYRKEHRSKGMELLSKRFRLLAKEYGAEVETAITDVMSEKESGTIVTIKVPNKLKSI